MKKIENFIAKLLVTITCILTFLIPVNNKKITFITYFTDELKGNFKLISNELSKRGSYKQIFLLKKFNNTLFSKFLYLVNFIVQTYHLNTSKVVIIDANNFVISNCRKKRKTKVIQIWHACGAIKKFGYDVNRRYKISNYDYVIVAGRECIEPFARAFGVDKSKVIPLGVAKTDRLFNEKIINRFRERTLEQFPQIKGKKVVLYAPTFRGDGVFHSEYININLEKIQKALGDDYVILYKLHPSLIHKSLGSNEQIINVNHKDIYRAFSVADILISDYSAIVFDFSILERPMIFYTPDLEEYKRDRGFYYDYESFVPGPICYNEDDVIKTIKDNKFDISKVKGIKERFFDFKDGKSTVRIVDHIESLINEKQ